MEKHLKDFNIDDNYLIPYGKDKFKIDYNYFNLIESRPNGKLILLTSITPTPAGEGKTTVSIGLNDAFRLLGKKSLVALREPSMGPVFGLKGGATGGGESILEPSDDINLHFTGDFHAITSAHNLLSALIDNHIYFGNSLNIKKVLWPRTIDVNDRSLRNITTKIREDMFVITAASEIMAIMALANDLSDLKMMLENITVGISSFDSFVYAKDIGGINALIALLKDAFNPNLVLSKEKNPALVHTGPFGNIAHGSSSIISSKLGLKLSDYLITEAGFGSDLGMEKFLDIKMLKTKNIPNLIVLVTTIHSLKYHGGSDDYYSPDLNALSLGLPNLEKHIDNIKAFNLKFVVAINKHHSNTLEEIDFLTNYLDQKGYKYEITNNFIEGGKGALDLAKLVINELEENPVITRPYDILDNPKLKIEKLAKKIYGANEVIFSDKALKELELYHDIIKEMPICIAKTHASFSDDLTLRGRPKNFFIKVNEIRLQTGSNFLLIITRKINTMPGLNKHPRALDF